MIREPLQTFFDQARAVKARSTPYLYTLAVKKGLIRGQRDYTRFIILGRSRVGSNFLRGLLNSHSGVTVFGELFQNKDQIGWAMPGYRQNDALLRLFHRDPIHFLERELFHPFPDGTAAVGFKLFYYHARDLAWRPVWDYLQQESDIKVIHIRRENILKTHLSKQQAELTDVWVDTDGDREKRPGVLLSYESCHEAFATTRLWEQEARQFFSGHPQLEVVYEQLAQDYAGEMARVQAFLEIPPEEVAPATFKQARQPLSQAILNYQQLKEQFATTEWASFFVE